MNRNSSIGTTTSKTLLSVIHTCPVLVCEGVGGVIQPQNHVGGHNRDLRHRVGGGVAMTPSRDVGSGSISFQQKCICDAWFAFSPFSVALASFCFLAFCRQTKTFARSLTLSRRRTPSGRGSFQRSGASSRQDQCLCLWLKSSRLSCWITSWSKIRFKVRCFGYIFHEDTKELPLLWRHCIWRNQQH